jgi:glutaredoxin-dependent peroxiredoxin
MAMSDLITTGAPAPGTKVPDFSLKLATKEGLVDFKLSEHLGKGPLVFAFYPLAFTGGCTKEMCDFRDNFAAFSSLDAQVYGFSTDSAPANRAFLEKEGLQFGILSDPNRQVVGKLWPAMATPVLGVDGVAQRGAMVVKPDGTVKWAFASPDTKVWVGTEEVRKHLR